MPHATSASLYAWIGRLWQALTRRSADPDQRIYRTTVTRITRA